MMQKWVSPFSLIEEDLWPTSTSWTQSSQGLSIFEDENSVTVEAAMPGLSENDVEITFDKGNLLVRGERKETQEDKNKKYYRKMSSSFMYHITVPGNIDESKEPHAEFKEGIAKIVFQKQKKAEPKRIPVQKGK